MHTAINADLVDGAGGGDTVDRRHNAAPPDSWRQWCRLCAKDDPHGNINVFFKDEQLTGGGVMLPTSNGADLSLTTAIGKYFWVNITRDEELPKMLCTECFSLVTSLVNFAERVGKVQQMFATLQGVKDGERSDLYTVRLHYGLLDEQREHVLMQQTLPEVHYFETKPKLNELEEKMFELEATSVAVNSATSAIENPLEQTRVRIKIKKEHVLEEGANMLGAPQAPDDDDNEEEEAVDPFNGADGDESDIADDDADAEADCDDDVDGVEDDDDDDEDESEQEFIATKLTSSSSDAETEDDDQIDTTPKQKRQKAPNNAKLQCRSLTPPPPKQRISQRKRKGTKQTSAAKSTKHSTDDVGLDDNGNNHNGNVNNDDDGNGGGTAAIFACTECPRRFKRVQHCRQHMKRTHAKSGPLHMVACEQCTRVFSTQNQLERHVKVHLPLQLKKVLPCPYCEKRFTSNTLVQTHIKYIHMNERPFICEECGVAVRTNAALKTHMLTHSDYAPFVCEVCQKGFKHQNRLKNHMETHDPTKHICAECGLQLNSRATLNRHLLVHSDAMQHKCDYCGRAFKRAKALKNHLILHTGLKPYSCDFCERTFANGSNCRSHKKKAHPEELAALEAAGGGKTYTRNIPKLEALKAVTKVADNLAPVVSKQSGRFAFGKKPKPPAATVAAKDAKMSHKIKSAEAEAAASTTAPSGVCSPDVNSQPAMVMAIAHSNVVAAAAAAIPAIDNIYNHIMKQATLAAHNVNALEAAKSTLDGAPVHHIKRPPSAASSSSCLGIDHEQLQQQQALSSGLQQHLQLQQQLQQQEQQHQLQQHALLAVQSLQQQQQQQPQQHLQQQQRQVEQLSALRSPDSQASSQMTDDQSNGSTQFYSHISRNMQGPFM